MAIGATGSAFQAQMSIVGNAFVNQYYNVIHRTPQIVHCFYKDSSRLYRAEVGSNGTVDTVTAQAAIREKITSLEYGDSRAKITSIDSQESLNGSMLVMVTGAVFTKSGSRRNFVQTFFLAPQEKGFFILNDMFRYLDGEPESLVTPSAPSSNGESMLESNVNRSIRGDFESRDYKPPVSEGLSGDDYISLPQEDNGANGTEEGASVDDGSAVVSSAIEEVPKDGSAPIDSTPPSLSGIQTSHGDATNLEQGEDGRQVDTEGDNRSVYVKNLPIVITQSDLEKEFEKFGPLKPGGANLRNQKMGVCFAFIEYEDSSSAQRAIEASPIIIGGRQVYVEEKRTMVPRDGRGRFNQGRGYQNEGLRRRGYYGQGYVRSMGGGQNSNRGYKRGPNRGNYGSNSYSSRSTYRRSDSQSGNVSGPSGEGAKESQMNEGNQMEFSSEGTHFGNQTGDGGASSVQGTEAVMAAA